MAGRTVAFPGQLVAMSLSCWARAGWLLTASMQTRRLIASTVCGAAAAAQCTSTWTELASGLLLLLPCGGCASSKSSYVRVRRDNKHAQHTGMVPGASAIEMIRAHMCTSRPWFKYYISPCTCSVCSCVDKLAY